MTAATPRKRDGFGVVGIGLAACAACCAAPIVAFVGGLSLAGAVSSLFIGVSGLLVALLAGVGYVILRQRRTRVACSTAPAGPVPAAAPVRRR